MRTECADRELGGAYVGTETGLQTILDLGLPWRPRLYLLTGGKLTFLNLNGSLIVTVDPPRWWRTEPWSIFFLNEFAHHQEILA